MNLNISLDITNSWKKNKNHRGQTFVEAKEILKSLGMNFTEAVNIFATMVVQERGLPFDVKLPNEKTIKEAEVVVLDTF